MTKKNLIIILISLALIIILAVFLYYTFTARKVSSPAFNESVSVRPAENFNVIHYDYSRIQWPINLNGQLAYLVERGDEQKIIYENQEYLKFNKQDGVLINLININGKIGYILKKDSKQYLGLEGKIVSEGYDEIEKILAEEDGSIYLKVRDKDRQFLIKNGEVIYPDALKCDIELTNERKVAVLLKYPNELDLIYNNEKYRFEKATLLGYINVWNDKLIYLLGENGKRVLVYGDEKIRDERGDITSYRIINGNLAYTVFLGQKPFNIFKIVYQGKLIGDEYATVYRYFGVDNDFFTDALRYIAITNDNKYVIVVDNKEISRPYEEILLEDNKSPITVADKVAFVARENNEEFVVYNGEELPHYKTINFLTSVSNKLVFVATDENFNSYLFIEK